MNLPDNGVHPFKVLYAEIAALALITVASMAWIRSAPHLAGPSEFATAWEFIPYINLYSQELREKPGMVAGIGVYYLLSVLVVCISQYLLLRGRGKLRPFDTKVFLAVSLMSVLLLVAWIFGRESGIPLYNLKLHDPNALGVYMIPLLIPSFQFIVSVFLLANPIDKG